MLDRKIFFTQMMLLENTYKVQVFTLPEETAAQIMLKDSRREMWYESVKHMPDETFPAAVAHLIKHHEYDTLKPANLVSSCKAILRSCTDDQYEAWKQIKKALIYCHPVHSIDMIDNYCTETTKRLIDDFGGFKAISEMDLDQLHFTKIKFEKRHVEIVNQAVERKIDTGEDLLEFNQQKLLGVKE